MCFEAGNARCHHEITRLATFAPQQLSLFEGQPVLGKRIEHWLPDSQTAIAIAPVCKANVVIACVGVFDCVFQRCSAQCASHPFWKGSLIGRGLMVVVDQQRAGTVLCITHHFESIKSSVCVHFGDVCEWW